MTGHDGGRWTGLVLGAALVALALVAGLNFTFAVAVMPNLAGVDDSTFVTITQRFNANPVFPLSFTVALLLTALAVALQGWHTLGIGRPGGRASGTGLRWTVAALALYGVVLAITGGLHIPLNEQVSQAGDPSGIADVAHVRDRFEGPWVAGNIVRTLFCTAAVAVLARAVLLHGRRTTRGPG